MDRFVISIPRVTLSDSSASSETVGANPDVDANKPAAEARPNANEISPESTQKHI